MTTVKQKAAQVANWHRRQVIGACAIVHIPTLGNPEDDADLRVAQAALRQISDRHGHRQLVRGLTKLARQLARTGSPLEIKAVLEAEEGSWQHAPEAKALLEATYKRKVGAAVDKLMQDMAQITADNVKLEG